MVPLLRMRAISKDFDGIEVLKDVDLEVTAGEVHALVGENGAGKSTLMNLLAGVHRPTRGVITFDGRELTAVPGERAAQELGIAIVFQERSLFGELTVAENVFAGRPPRARFGRVDRAKMRAATSELLSRVGLRVSPEATVAELSLAHQQLVEVAKALSVRAKLMVFDEPTAALTDTETRALFSLIRQLQADGVGVIYISHRLEEVFQIANRVTVLKDGVVQGTFPVPGISSDELVRRMVGRELALRHNASVADDEPVLLEVRGLSDPRNRPGLKPLLDDVSFTARAGEIVGFAGLAGAGRTETALALFGLRPRGSGEIRVGGKPLGRLSPEAAIAAGLGYASEDRKEGALFLNLSIARNVASANLRHFGRWHLDARRERDVAEDYRAKLRIACRDTGQEVYHLSGGNQQKVVLAKWLLVGPKVLIVDEPTRGIDVAAKAEVHLLLYRLSRQGAAVIVISSELPEILGVSDRIYVMRQGRITAELPRNEANEETIMRYASLNLN